MKQVPIATGLNMDEASRNWKNEAYFSNCARHKMSKIIICFWFPLMRLNESKYYNTSLWLCINKTILRIWAIQIFQNIHFPSHDEIKKKHEIFYSFSFIWCTICNIIITICQRKPCTGRKPLGHCKI